MNNQYFDDFWLTPFNGTKFSNPEAWTTQDFIGEIQLWPRLPIVLAYPKEQEYLIRLRKFYCSFSVWLNYSLVEMNASERENLRLIIHFTDDLRVKPDADFSLAIRSLCYQVYGKSKLFTLIPSFEHIWFLVEYSNCQQRIKHSGLLTGFPTTRENGKLLSKDSVTTRNSDSIKIYKKALRHGLLDTEKISPDHYWGEYFLNILIAESVKTALENQDEDLKHHCMEFLNSFSYYNRLLGGSTYQLSVLINGQETKSTVGKKSISLINNKKHPKGRPIGSQNKKGM
jgi:hypothetical protein